MEHWAWDKDILQAISPGMPDATIEQLIASRKLSTVLKLSSNIRFAFFDMRIHKNDPSDATLSVEEIFSDSSILKCAPLEYNYVNRFPHSFQYGHYAASFYTYIWANVLASNVFMQFKGAESKREVGTRFLQTILANGASQPAMDLFVQFNGHTPQIEPFLKTYGLETSSIKPKS